MLTPRQTGTSTPTTTPTWRSMLYLRRRPPEPGGEPPVLVPPRDAADIVDTRAVGQGLQALALETGGVGAQLQRQALAVLRRTLEDGRREIRRRFFEENTAGPECMKAQAYLADRLTCLLADLAAELLAPAQPDSEPPEMAIIATGGYGRAELAPFSDIDLLFLLPEKKPENTLGTIEEITEFMLYLLWDLGLKVGHAVRTVEECLRGARQDMTIRTNLLETRFLWGRRQLERELRRRLHREVIVGTGPAFVEAKLAERDDRHQKLGDSRYVLEPNVKEGKGGLRDLQTLFWIAKYLYQVHDIDGLVGKGVLSREEAQRFAKAANFLSTLRCHLHYLAGRAEERLTFDVQTEIATRMGYVDRDSGASSTARVERFMKHYFLVAKDVGDLTRIVCAALEAESQRKPRRSLLPPFGPRYLDGFKIDRGRLNVTSESWFRERPVDLIRLFHVAQRHELDVHPNALRLIARSLRQVGAKLRQDPEANRLFLEILTSDKAPELALRRMNEAGVLGRFVPDFGRVVAQMQYDMYHVYTVDEHTLFAIGHLHKLETGELSDTMPLAAEVMKGVASRRALYVAVLLHDIAKGRGGDHSVIGARIARHLGPRLGLTDEETETTEWLVLNHLVMSRAALKRDIEDDKTVEDFVWTVESPERLRLLFVLTCVDISAVGPGRWTAWKGTLLANLYYRSMDRISGSQGSAGRDRRVLAAQENVRRALAVVWPADAIDTFLSRGYPGYWLSFDAEAHARHARLVRQAERELNSLVIDTRVDWTSGVTEITIVAGDHPGLFSSLAGALAVCGANIVDAKIFTLTNGMALDVFSVQDAFVGGPFEAPDKLAKLAVIIDRGLSGELSPLKELEKRRTALPSRTRVFKVQPRVLIDNNASNTHTVIEVNGRDRPGLLYDVTHALTELSLQISSAKVSTYGVRAVDVFYVKDVFGLKITHEQKLQQTRQWLMASIADPDCAPGPTAAPPPSLSSSRPVRRPTPALAEGPSRPDGQGG